MSLFQTFFPLSDFISITEFLLDKFIKFYFLKKEQKPVEPTLKTAFSLIISHLSSLRIN